MGRLSHIDDFQDESVQEQQQAQTPAPEPAPDPEPELEPVVQESQAVVTEAPASQKQAKPYKSAAQAEADFHGLGKEEKRPIGQKALIVAAIVILAVAVVYVLNYSLHLF